MYIVNMSQLFLKSERVFVVIFRIIIVRSKCNRRVIFVLISFDVTNIIVFLLYAFVIMNVFGSKREHFCFISSRVCLPQTLVSVFNSLQTNFHGLPNLNIELLFVLSTSCSIKFCVYTTLCKF